MAKKRNEIKMAALGRCFQVGTLYDYRNDEVITDGQLTYDLDDLEIDYNKFKFKSSCHDSQSVKDKWEVMRFGEHLEISAMAELLNRYRGASNYMKDKLNHSQVNQVVVLRAKSRRERLNFQTHDVPHLMEMASHVVVGVTYGLEAYCVLTQDLDTKLDDEDAREKSKQNLTSLGNKLVNALLENQQDFIQQLNKEEIQALNRIRCRLYADLQTQSVKECSVVDAYKHCMKLIDEAQITDEESKAVPISVALYPLKLMLKSTKEIGKQLQYRDVDGDVVSRCCNIFMKLERVMFNAEIIRATIQQNRRESLRHFIDAIGKFQNILKKDLRLAVVKAREEEDGNDDGVVKIIDLAKMHPLFKLRSLKLWLDCKKDEPKILEEISNTKGITLFANEDALLNNLACSDSKTHALVLFIPPVDQRTKDSLAKMKDYLKRNQTLVIDKDCDKNKEEGKDEEKAGKAQKQVQDKIRELMKHANRNKHLKDAVQFLMAFADNCEGLCRYSIYKSDIVLKENIVQLPRPPVNFKIKAKNASSVQIEWDHQELGYPFNYLVEYRCKNSSDQWIQQKTVKPGEHQMTINLKDGADMEIQVATDTCIGRSEFTSVIDTNSFMDDTTEIDTRDNGSDIKKEHQLPANTEDEPVIKIKAQPGRPKEITGLKKPPSSTSFATNLNGIVQKNCIEMAALGRRFEMGQLYDYRNDKVTDDWLEFESEIEMEEENLFKLSMADSAKNKWEFFSLEEHLKASTVSGLIDRLKGASNYLNDKTSSSQASRVLFLRTVTIRKKLNLINPIDYELVKSNATKSTHLVVGATYGLEAYCIIFQDLDDSENREDADRNLFDLVKKLQIFLNEKQDWAEFEDQFSNKGKQRLKEKIKCRLYSDSQTQTVRECSVAEAYKYYMKLIEQVQQSDDGESKAVPISVTLCPLKRLIDPTKRAGFLLQYRDVDDDFVTRCYRIWIELERAVEEAENFRISIKNKNKSLREFIDAIVKFQSLFKKELKVAVINARETADGEDDEITRVVDIVERHPLFKPKKLNRWLEYKKSELEMSEKMDKIKGISVFASKREVVEELSDSYDSKCALVMWIPPLDGNTSEILVAMSDYVVNYTKLISSPSSKNKKTFKDGKDLPWHMDDRKKPFVNEKIRKYVDYVSRNKSAEGIKFFLASGENGSKFGCRYSVYRADVVLKEDLEQLPNEPKNVRIQQIPSNKSRSAKNLQSICVLWDYEDLGYPHHFVVEYRVKDGDNEPWKQQKTSKQGETQLTVNIPAGEVVEVRVAADTCIGRSEFSETTDTESLEIDDCGSGQYEDADNSSQSSGHEKTPQGLPPRYSREVSTNTGHRQFQRDLSFTSSPVVHFDYSGHAHKETPTRLTRQESLNRSMKTEQVGSNIYQEPTSTRTGQETFVQRQSSCPSNYATRFDSPKPYSNPRSPMDQPSSVAFTPEPKVRVKADPAGQASNNLSSGYQTFHCQEQLPRQSPPTPAPRTRPILNQRIKTASQLQGRNIRFAEAITSHCNKIGIRNGLDLYSVPLTKSSDIGSIAERFSFGGADGRIQRKTILVMGATGSGKTMLINAMINYIFDVQWRDNFRFQLINEEIVGQSQAHSQTSKITAYDIYHQEGFRVPYSVTIVDTPGYGDTKGLDRDQEITEMIRTFFQDKNGIQELNVVGFVAAAPITRLTPTQTYIFDSVLSIFGNDVKDNINFLLTFADSQLPPILNAIIEAGLDNGTKNPLHHKFNNSGFFCSNREIGNTADKFNQFFWRMGMENFEKFFLVLNKMKSKSLSLTKEVLEERKQLEATIDGLQPLIKIGLAKMDEIRKIKELIADNQTQIEGNEAVPFEYEGIGTRKVDIPVELFVTNCNKCNVTCHYPCSSEEDEDKFDCSAMDKSMPEATRRCTVCPGKCLWTFHASQSYRWEYVKVKQTTTSDAIKTTYESERNTPMTSEDLIQALQQTIEENEEAMAEKVKTVTKCIARLEEIALRPTPFSSTQYIDLIIDAEMEENLPGLDKRITSLEKLRSMAEIQEKIRNKASLLESNY